MIKVPNHDRLYNNSIDSTTLTEEEFYKAYQHVPGAEPMFDLWWDDASYKAYQSDDGSKWDAMADHEIWLTEVEQSTKVALIISDEDFGLEQHFTYYPQFAWWNTNLCLEPPF